MRTVLLLVSLLVTVSIARAAEQTFCNPLDLDYGQGRAAGWRHGADPAVVLYHDRYYLFSTWDQSGYRVSDDLVHWKLIRFAPATELENHIYTAAATLVLDDGLYFTELGNEAKPASLWRTKDPDSGRWEKVRDGLKFADPCLFQDPASKKIFLYYGLDRPLHGVELDPDKHFATIESTDKQLLPTIDPKAHIDNGWEVCTWDNNEQSKPMRGNKTFNTCREGSWMTCVAGKCYLQFATPGTTIPGYCDGLAMADAPLGPFTLSPYSPISWKDSGFITSAGHSCLFQDRYGNWWRAVTMLIGVKNRFERRIGLFPAGFDSDGIPFTRTETDSPICAATAKRDHSYAADDIFSGWSNLAAGKPVQTSSTLDDAHAGALAADEDVRTWWSAKSGEKGEWLQIDLGAPTEIKAAQVNLAEQDYADFTTPDKNGFVLAASSDGQTWTTILDKTDNTIPSPHAYAQFDKPVTARYFKLTNLYTPGGAKFAVSDLRLFGVAHAAKPQPVKQLAAERDEKDRRKVTLSWNAADGATAYLIRFGITAEKLYQHHLVRGGQTNAALYCLSRDPSYFFRVDTINDAGTTRGESVVSAP